MTWEIKAALFTALLLAPLASPERRADAARPPLASDDHRAVVIAELFTSEGCSSCPPADTLLRRILSTQPIDGVEVVALSNHVDYWDRLGWRDPFSSRLLSDRQAAYDSLVFRSKGSYTPQLVVDGATECVASDERAVRALLRDAPRQPKGTVSLVTAVASTSATLQIHWTLPSSVPRRGAADVIVAITEDDLSTQVLRGENRGRQLAHSAVVRLLATVAHASANEHEASATTTMTLDSHWSAAHLRAVGFIQEQSSRRIIAAGSSALMPAVSSQRHEVR